MTTTIPAVITKEDIQNKNSVGFYMSFAEFYALMWLIKDPLSKRYECECEHHASVNKVLETLETTTESLEEKMLKLNLEENEHRKQT